MKLFCVHYAGGSAIAFQSLLKVLQDELEVIPIELPGRGKRIDSELIFDFKDACMDLVSIIKERVNKKENFSLLGHSMGSLLSFEIAHLFQEERYSLSHIFLTGTKLPYQFENKSLIEISQRNDEVIDRITKLGGTPPELLEHPYFLKMYLPIIKADLHLIGSYKYKQKGKLEIPITVINGNDDPLANNDLDKWLQLTTNKVEVLMVDGGHFFLSEQKEFLSKSICLNLKKEVSICK
ncbi:thioesterase II family protein [Priestia aryabhattai]|uniref:thioesterase II family protein n=1 Tax=Priestia aryabhattai TaxID=412384 RepID=UPI0018754C49|nr:alpha/beta fold hydrolase [Priestia aryabhattai]MBE5102260.1 thioesterase [Priestia aryabhattai]